MNVTTSRDLIKGVASAWRRQYQFRYKDDEQKAAIGAKLDALDGDTATSEEVEAIIGNRSWTRQLCNECGEPSDWLLMVGQPTDYESQTASLCRACILKAAELAAE